MRFPKVLQPARLSPLFQCSVKLCAPPEWGALFLPGTPALPPPESSAGQEGSPPSAPENLYAICLAPGNVRVSSCRSPRATLGAPTARNARSGVNTWRKPPLPEVDQPSVFWQRPPPSAGITLAESVAYAATRCVRCRSQHPPGYSNYLNSLTSGPGTAIVYQY